MCLSCGVIAYVRATYSVVVLCSSQLDLTLTLSLYVQINMYKLLKSQPILKTYYKIKVQYCVFTFGYSFMVHPKGTGRMVW